MKIGKMAIIGTGNIGRAMARGLAASNLVSPADLVLTRRHVDKLQDLADMGFVCQADNQDAVRQSDVIILSVEPHNLDELLEEIANDLTGDKLVISVVSGATINQLRRQIGSEVTLVRAMPNTAIALQQSMTCLATDGADDDALDKALKIFGALGQTQVIDEDQMAEATALCACGIAFFLRVIRAASQGGIEIGFHPEDSLKMAAQTAMGAASLLLGRGQHPEREIDRVTTPRGCTISGLNEMEHCGLSSAMIKGILTSAQKAETLYSPEG